MWNGANLNAGRANKVKRGNQLPGEKAKNIYSSASYKTM
jgi:hypothetical protein